MLQSMTGFGKAMGTLNNISYNVELKSLNSKQTDIYIRIPNAYKSKELELRTYIGNELSRGKIELGIHLSGSVSENKQSINIDLAKQYHAQLKELADALNEPSSELLTQVLKMPEVMVNAAPEINVEEWAFIKNLVEQAVATHREFRLAEGKTLEDDFKERINQINALLLEVDKYEDVRLESVRARLNKGVEDLLNSENLDKNRHEQEIIYYIEKLDIKEEKVRLNAHLKYFIETMNAHGANGKKLGFITQEMGREINTLGSKANHQEIQKIVVQMKDQLEKMKEQVLNVL